MILSFTIMNTGGGIFMYDIRVYYTINPLNPYSLCERSTDNSDSHYNTDIFSSESDYINGIFHNNNDGTYSSKYNLIANGWVTLRIFQLFSWGLRGKYYNNVWFIEPPILKENDITGKKTVYNIIPVDVQHITITNDETVFQILDFSESLINSDTSIKKENKYT